VKDILTALGYPSPEKQDIVQFYFGKSLSYKVRLVLIYAFVIGGLLTQLLLFDRFAETGSSFISPNIWIGAVLMIIGVSLGLVRGYNNRFDTPVYVADLKWLPTTMDKLDEIAKLEKRIVKWDRAALDITNGIGITAFIGLGVLFGFLFFVFLSRESYLEYTYKLYYPLACWLFIDVNILFLPFWITGIRKILRQPDLVVKATNIQKLADYFDLIKQEGESLVPEFNISEKKASAVPQDARITVQFKNKKEGFYNLMGQVCINNVQGTSYPYFYCVIVAKEGYGLMKTEKYFDPLAAAAKGSKIIKETKIEKGVEIIIIRQYTTARSGYHTNPATAQDILNISLEMARKALAD
jgi:hypothetical protein